MQNQTRYSATLNNYPHGCMGTEMDDTRPYPNRLKGLRESRELTQAEVAKLTDQDVTTVCRHESQTRKLPREAVQKYSRIFKVDTIEIYFDPKDLYESDRPAASA